MYDIATTQERERERKQTVSQVDQEDSDAEEDNASAFQHCQNKQKVKPRSNHQAGQVQNQSGFWTRQQC